MTEGDLPRIHPTSLHIATGPFDVTITWLDIDPTVLPPDEVGPHEATTKAIAQTVLSYGAAKALIPLLVRCIANYEQKFGEIPAPGFDETSKEGEG